MKVWEVERSFNKKRETEKITSIINYHTQKNQQKTFPVIETSFEKKQMTNQEQQKYEAKSPYQSVYLLPRKVDFHVGNISTKHS